MSCGGAAPSPHLPRPSPPPAGRAERSKAAWGAWGGRPPEPLSQGWEKGLPRRQRPRRSLPGGWRTAPGSVPAGAGEPRAAATLTFAPRYSFAPRHHTPGRKAAWPARSLGGRLRLGGPGLALTLPARRPPPPRGSAAGPPCLHPPSQDGEASFFRNVYLQLCSASSGGPGPPGGLLHALPGGHVQVQSHPAGAGRPGHVGPGEAPLRGDRPVCVLPISSCKTGGFEGAPPRSQGPLRPPAGQAASGTGVGPGVQPCGSPEAKLPYHRPAETTPASPGPRAPAVVKFRS